MDLPGGTSGDAGLATFLLRPTCQVNTVQNTLVEFRWCETWSPRAILLECNAAYFGPLSSDFLESTNAED